MTFADDMAEYRRDVRLYQVWPGKNRFLCGGRLMTGPWSDCPFNTCVWGIILVPVTGFYVFCGAKLWHNSPALLVAVTICFFWTTVCLLLTGWSDPGIIPRQTRQDAWKRVWAARGMPEDVDEDGAISADRSLPSSLTIVNEETGERETHRYCHTCNIYRPPRASHCHDCDNCVKEFDHHCPFVGNCVAERNYGAFCAFLVCVVALLVSVLTSVVMSSSQIQADTTFNMVMQLVIAGYSLLMFFMIGGFSVFHCFLIITGQTTKEKIKGTADGKARTVTCLNRPPVLFDPRQLANPELDPENASLLAV